MASSRLASSPTVLLTFLGFWLIGLATAINLPINACDGNDVQVISNALANNSDEDSFIRCTPPTAIASNVVNLTATTPTRPATPFDYRVPESDISITFTKYDEQMDGKTALLGLIQSQLEVLTELQRLPGKQDVTVGTTRVFFKDDVIVTIFPASIMYHVDLVIVLAGIAHWGEEYDFVEVNMEFWNVALPNRVSLGTGIMELM